jgi:hypothetical protein
MALAVPVANVTASIIEADTLGVQEGQTSKTQMFSLDVHESFVRMLRLPIPARPAMRFFPTPESSGEIVLDWLHQEGWTVAHSQCNGEWSVEAIKGIQRIKTIGTTLEHAWYRATEQAKLLRGEPVQ